MADVGKLKLDIADTANHSAQFTEINMEAAELSLYGFIYKLMWKPDPWADDNENDKKQRQSLNDGFLAASPVRRSVCVDVESEPGVVGSWREWLYRNRFHSSASQQESRGQTLNKFLIINHIWSGPN